VQFVRIHLESYEQYRLEQEKDTDTARLEDDIFQEEYKTNKQARNKMNEGLTSWQLGPSSQP
jgi:hypothetical protein